MKKMDHMCKDTPVIMLTANAVTGAKEQYMREGFESFLTKPIVPERLDKAILMYLAFQYGYIPVVFLTAVNDKAHIAAVLKMNPAGYLLKPADRNRVMQTIHKILGD